jgi:hypothetical protein
MPTYEEDGRGRWVSQYGRWVSQYPQYPPQYLLPRYPILAKSTGRVATLQFAGD